MTQSINPNLTSAFPGDSVPYATPLPRRYGPRTWAGAAILLAGLGLIALGGCFLVGVLGIVSPSALNGTAGLNGAINSAQFSLMIVLYVLAFACFGGAVALLYLGVRGLIRVMQS